MRKGWNVWLPLLLIRQQMRRAAISFVLRHRRKGFNGWLTYANRKKAACVCGLEETSDDVLGASDVCNSVSDVRHSCKGERDV